MTELEKRFVEFVRTLKSAEIVDELTLTLEQKQAEKPDFFFFDRQFIGEMKSIEKDMEHKVHTILDKHKDRPEFPIFYGECEVSQILKHLPDGESINQDIFFAITSALEGSVEKANRQIRKTKEVFDLNHSEGILIVLNDLVGILSPDIIAHKIHQLFNKKYPTGDVRYPYISVAWIISEIHILEVGLAQNLLPSIVIVNDHASSWQKADNYLNWLQKEWASFNNMPFIEGNSDMKSLSFSKRRELNSSSEIPQSNMWKRQSSNMPSLRHLSKEQLLEYGQQLFQETLIGSHEQSSKEEILKLVERRKHFIEEMNFRGIDSREFSLLQHHNSILGLPPLERLAGTEFYKLLILISNSETALELKEAFKRLEQEGKPKTQD